MSNTKQAVKDIALRRNDVIGDTVLRRIEDIDLVAVGARYHISCYNTFRLEKPSPCKGQPIRGRPRKDTTSIFWMEDIYRAARASAKQEATETGGAYGEGQHQALADIDQPSTSADIFNRDQTESLLLNNEEDVEVLLQAFEREQVLHQAKPAAELSAQERAQRLAALGRIAATMNVGPTCAAALLLTYTQLLQGTLSMPLQHAKMSHWFNRMRFLFDVTPIAGSSKTDENRDKTPKVRTENMVINEGEEEIVLEIKEEVPSDHEGDSTETAVEDLERIRDKVKIIIENLQADSHTLQSEKTLMTWIQNLPIDDDTSNGASRKRRKISNQTEPENEDRIEVPVEEPKEFKNKSTQTNESHLVENEQKLIVGAMNKQFQRMEMLIEKRTTSLKNGQEKIKRSVEGLEPAKDSYESFGLYVASMLRCMDKKDASHVQNKIAQFVNDAQQNIIAPVLPAGKS